MSNFYICDYCRYKLDDNIPLEGYEGRILCANGFQYVLKKPMHDGIDKPTDACEEYESRKDG